MAYPKQPPLTAQYQGLYQPRKNPIVSNGSGVPDIHKDINFLQPDDIEDYLIKNPQTVNQKGFVGQSPLHRICLGCEYSLANLLIKYGADVNARNDYGETPLHYACKRGSPQLIHTLLSYGADVNAIDNSGKGVMHHASLGGGVYGMIYLERIMKIGWNVVDHSLTTPLHLTASIGHIEGLKFFMKNNRCNLFAKDAGGNTALHVAAQLGHSFTCWVLLDRAGPALAFERNNDGCTALDIAKQGQPFRMRQTTKLLELYEKSGDKQTDITRPIVVWYWLLLMPFLLYAWLIFLSQFCPYKGLLVAAGIGVICYILLQQSHRMFHISRWPNPVFTGLFAAGLSHTLLCYYINIAPILYQTQSFFVFLSVILTFLIGFIYYKLLTVNPGEVTESARKEDTGEFYTILDIATEKLENLQLCMFCEIIPPKRGRHCRLCEKCFSEMDHHCLFLYRCIAKNNHRLFVYFISVCLLCMIIFVGVGFKFLLMNYPQYDLTMSSVLLICDERPWIVSLLCANTISIFWGINLLKYQFQVISRGHTTAYQPLANIKVTPLTKQQRFKNLVHFFTGRQPYIIDNVMDF